VYGITKWTPVFIFVFFYDKQEVALTTVSIQTPLKIPSLCAKLIFFLIPIFSFHQMPTGAGLSWSYLYLWKAWPSPHERSHWTNDYLLFNKGCKVWSPHTNGWCWRQQFFWSVECTINWYIIQWGLSWVCFKCPH